MVALSLTVVSCGDNGDSSEAGGKAGGDGPFEEKQGTVEMKMEMMGMTPTMTLYFDDYGKKQATYTMLEMMGKKMENVTLLDGGFATSWDNSTKTGTKAKADGRSGGPIELIAGLTDARKKSLNYKEIESRELLGNTASGFSIDSGGAEMKVWHYKGVPLLIEMNASGQLMKITATRIDFDTPVPAGKFVVPADVKISDAGSMPSAMDTTMPPAQAPASGDGSKADTTGK